MLVLGYPMDPEVVNRIFQKLEIGDFIKTKFSGAERSGKIREKLTVEEALERGKLPESFVEMNNIKKDSIMLVFGKFFVVPFNYSRYDILEIDSKNFDKMDYPQYFI